jgi:hypothetical protein
MGEMKRAARREEEDALRAAIERVGKPRLTVTVIIAAAVIAAVLLAKDFNSTTGSPAIFRTGASYRICPGKICLSHACIATWEISVAVPGSPSDNSPLSATASAAQNWSAVHRNTHRQPSRSET